ncbi:hypothetical protein SCHPADRAFT_897049 [Schizopora paradoxa]|uniref:Uncharacterized protein n=1 Tax=Schizopora paradoxa TaxID=27342 RepID=A0A0H2QZL2_9AGAM|nr:hypothetical protein SCHPADRAFT_897049 [Schizopora paradoxa]
MARASFESDNVAEGEGEAPCTQHGGLKIDLQNAQFAKRRSDVVADRRKISVKVPVSAVQIPKDPAAKFLPAPSQKAEVQASEFQEKSAEIPVGGGIPARRELRIERKLCASAIERGGLNERSVASDRPWRGTPPLALNVHVHAMKTNCQKNIFLREI